MKYIVGVLTLSLGTFVGTAQAVVLYEQPLPTWNVGWCSPCHGTLQSYDYRTFASFSLGNDSILQGGNFAVYDESANSYDLNISIWDVPLGNELYSLSLPGGAYTVVPKSAYTYNAVVDLPNWNLVAGAYWISIFGINGNPLGWGTDNSSSNDRQYHGNGVVHLGNIYVGYSFSGAVVPEPGSAALLSFATLVLSLLCPRRMR